MSVPPSSADRVRNAFDRIAPGDRPLSSTQYGALATVIGLTVVVVVLLPDGGAARAVLALVMAGALGLVCARSSTHGMFAVLAWLAASGGVRRVVTTFQADPARDPLLLVAPVAVGILALHAVRAGALGRRSALANVMLILGVVTVAFAFHPDQGGLDVGLGGVLFWFVPMLWFWIGRALVDGRLARRVVWFTAAVAVLASTYGLFQTVVGFPSWDRDYILTRGRENSLYVGPDTFRPFAAFAAANEYALTTAVGLVIFLLVAALGVTKRNRRVAAVGFCGLGLTGAGLALSSYRAPVLLVGIAVVVLAVVRLRRAAIPVALGAIVLFGLAGVAISQVDPDSLSVSGTEGMVRRVVVGLADPFDPEDSTLTIHLRALRGGVEEAFRDPFGDGTGSTTTAARTFGERTSGTEWDVSDGAVAFGIVGLLLVAGASVLAFVRVGSRAWHHPGLVNLATLGIMIVLLRHWWNGGHYFLAPVLWVLIGSRDARVRTRPRTMTRA